MSLAMFAAPFNNDNNDNNDNEIINKKKQAHNKTQKIYPKENFDTNKVKSVLEKIHGNNNEEDDEENKNSGLFNPPPKPESAGVNKTIATENMMNMTNNNNNLMFKTLGRAPQPSTNENGNYDLNDYNNYMNINGAKTAEEYYAQILPGYQANSASNRINNLGGNGVNKPYYNNVNYNNNQSYNNNNMYSPDLMMQKINYLINLLEEQQDERTNNVAEEVVLYSFLGIFIIFIVDSFSKVGKYVR